MPVGPFIRGLLGPLERPASDAYRSVFVDLDELTAEIGRTRPTARRILEIGCGEGAVTERLVELYPEAEILAIDVTPRLGRMFRGDATRVRFRQVQAETIASEAPAAFDLVLLCDVLHHVPVHSRASILAAAARALADGGTFFFKDWAPSRTIIHVLVSATDRFITGDDVSYVSEAQARVMLEQAFGSRRVSPTSRVVPPRMNNYVLVVPP